MKRCPVMMPLAFALLAAGIVGTLPVRAALLTYSVALDNDGAYYESGTGGSFTLAQFDAGLGTLQSVVLSVTAAAYGGSIWVDNEWTAAGKVQLELGSYLSLTTPEYAELGFAPAWTTPLSVLAADEADDGDGTGFSGFDSLLLNGTTLAEEQTYVPTDLSLYLGSGRMTYSFWGESYSSIYALAPLDVDGRLADEAVLSNYGLSVSIAYTYIPQSSGGGGEEDDGGEEGGDSGGVGNVPEPGTLSMALVLFGSFWAARCRRRRALNAEGDGDRRGKQVPS